MNGPVSIRPYRSGDESGICGLFKVCRRRDLPLDAWRRRYAMLPAGKPVIEVGASGREIVAHLGVLPQRLRRGTKTARGGLWVDLMVHPRFRNLTLFLDLAEANRERSRRHGIDLLYAFPNDRSYPVLKRMLDWQTIEEIDALEAPIGSVRHAQAGQKSAGRSDGRQVKPVLDFDKVFDEFWRSARPKNLWTVDRNAEWLRRRYGAGPEKPYVSWAVRGADERLEGWLIAKAFSGPDGVIGDILDLWALPWEPAAGLLWGAALDYFRRAGVKTVSAWAMKETAMMEHFESWGLSPQGPRTHFAGRWTASAAEDAFPAKGRDWSISKGDSDVF